MTMKLKATPQVVEDYKKLFVNRRAYTMQSLRPHPKTGRHYYFRPNKRGTDIPAMLTDQTIRRHLEGEITLGLYAINPSTQRCKWVAIDADYRHAKIKVPTLIIVGDHDESDPKMSKEMQEKIA